MSYIRMMCFSCGCFFDPEFFNKVDGMEYYLLCSRCGNQFATPTRCPKCGSLDLEPEEPYDDPEVKCLSCSYEWDITENDDYWGETLKPVECPRCKSLNEIHECSESELHSGSFCGGCGKPLNDEEKPEDCQYCNDPKYFDQVCDPGNFICKSCSYKWSAKEYWENIWNN